MVYCSLNDLQVRDATGLGKSSPGVRAQAGLAVERASDDARCPVAALWNPVRVLRRLHACN